MAAPSSHRPRAVLIDGSSPLAKAQIPTTARLRDALESLNDSSCQVVLVVDEAERVLGLLTDGDLRRALLADATLLDSVGPIMRTSFTFVGPGTQRADVLDLMHSRRISEVPILDGERRLVGLHLLHDILGETVRPNHAVIMAGGRGTRLAPLTDSLPKPMVPVAGRPILERIVLHLVGCGIRTIHLSVNYLAEIIERHFEDGSRFGCSIRYLREDRPLGTAGALGLLAEPPADPVLVMNGDLVTQADVGAMLDFHRLQTNDASIAVRRYLHTVPFGCIETDGDRVIALDEKPTLQKTINAGIYVISPEVVAKVRPQGPLTMPELLSTVMASGGRVGAWEIEDDWLDIGQREQLERARGER